MPYIPGLGLLFTLFFVLGLMKGAVDVGGNTLLLWFFPKGASMAMNALHALFAVGAVVTPIVVGLTLTLTGRIDTAYGLLGLMILPFAFSFFFLPSPTPPPSHSPRRAGVQCSRRLLLICVFFFLYCGIEVGSGAGSQPTPSRVASKLLPAVPIWPRPTGPASRFGRLGSIPIARYLDRFG